MKQNLNKQQGGQIRYAKISLKKRQKLVYWIVQKKRKTAKTAKMIGIKLSTAKMIVKRYRESGTFFESKAEAAIREKTRREKALNKTLRNRPNIPTNSPSQQSEQLQEDPAELPDQNWQATSPFMWVQLWFNLPEVTWFPSFRAA